MEIAKYFCFAQQKRLQEGSLSGTLDWLTLGMVSGFVNGLNQRNQAFQQDPSFYNFINYMTIGAADVVKGAVAPDEPLSLEHWLNSLCVASIATGVYKAVTRSYDIPKNTKQLVQTAKHTERNTQNI